jgi:RNA-binding protein YlmH
MCQKPVLSSNTLITSVEITCLLSLPLECQALASAGVASRRNCIDLVKQGRVRVNSAVITDPATRVDPAADVLEVAGKGRLQLAAPGGPEVRDERMASSDCMAA